MIEERKSTQIYDKCPKCNSDLQRTFEGFTGTCNYNKGQYISFYYCPNKNCDRFGLFF